MPLIINNASKSIQDMHGLHEKRAARNANRTKYTIDRKKHRSPEEYKGIKLLVDGKEFPISDSVKFVLEQMVGDVTANNIANNQTGE